MTSTPMKSTQANAAAISKVLRVFSRARSMPGLRPVNRDIANPRHRERQQSGHALLALMSAMSVNSEHDQP